MAHSAYDMHCVQVPRIKLHILEFERCLGVTRCRAVCMYPSIPRVYQGKIPLIRREARGAGCQIFISCASVPGILGLRRASQCNLLSSLHGWKPVCQRPVEKSILRAYKADFEYYRRVNPDGCKTYISCTAACQLLFAIPWICVVGIQSLLITILGYNPTIRSEIRDERNIEADTADPTS
ncbi:hypothetical protein F5Y17DRAFT_350487 [Xylariaceae sp. FL0594]|nr:hypothetical protein F5Y17DRAFT_350487 [Xylariaceae sp. FL0594]